MNTADFPMEERLDRLEEATLWLQRMRTDTDGQVMEACVEWCQSDPQNQQAFDEMAALWEITGQVAMPVTSRVATAVPPVARRAISAPTSRRWALAASLAGLGFASLLAVWWVNRTSAPETVITAYYSPVGVNARHALADGSVLELGGGTRVTVSLGAHARRVELQEGELFVTVHHDEVRPFAVDAGRLEVLATGTAFNVLRTEERTIVTVAEGSVAASYEGQAAAVPNVHLQVRQQLVYSHDSHTVMVRQTDPAEVIAWRAGTLRFQNEALSEVIATVNRYADSPVLIEDPQLRALSFTGTARVDRIDSWLAGLPLVFPVSVEPMGDGRQLIRPRPGASAD